METILRVEQLKKTYGTVQAVKGISFDVSEKEIFALIGPNGAGKSTTLRILATILTPSSGKVSIGGYDLSHDPDNVRSVISYLPEEAGAYKNLKGIEYLRFMADLYAPSKAQSNEYVTFGRDVCGLGQRLNDKISTYSKGMARKLLLARTVMTKPKVAILDEPTSGLDVINAMEIRTIIKGLVEHGMSVILSSHNMLEIEYLSDRVGIINNGALLAVGTPNELKQRYKSDNLEEVFVSMVS